MAKSDPPKAFEIPESTSARRCASCDATVYFIRSDLFGTGLFSVNKDGTRHRPTCPGRDQWKK